jgi:hypothetical protein
MPHERPSKLDAQAGTAVERGGELPADALVRKVEQLREAGRARLREAQKLKALLTRGDVEDTPQARRELDDLGTRAQAHFDQAAALEEGGSR